MDAGRIRELGRLRPPDPTEGPGQGVGPAPTAQGPTFGQALANALEQVDAGLQQGDAQAAAYVGGENVDLHNVLLDLERADLGLRTLLQIRNKLVDAYKEVMRIPV